MLLLSELWLTSCGGRVSRDDGDVRGTGGTSGGGGDIHAVGRGTAIGDTLLESGGTTPMGAGTGGMDTTDTTTGGAPPTESTPSRAIQRECPGGPLECQGESCCATINVPGGTFTQGGSPEEVAEPAHPSTVSEFALDKYEVTVGRFRQFVAAYASNTANAPVEGAGANPAIEGTGWQSEWNMSIHVGASSSDEKATWTDTPGTAAEESRAINYVDWYTAFAFCIWDGGRLPTESEWECAAAGGSENRIYPWGNTTPDCAHANFYSDFAPCQPYGSEGVVAVGSFPAGNGRWGHADLAGNVDEWVFDWDGAYPESACDNYANTTPSSGRGLRGGFYLASAANLRAARRLRGDPGSHLAFVGVRCARAVQ